MKPAKRKILFVHINLMERYAGYDGDIDPREKHSHAKRDGVSERFNFKLAPDGKFYGAWCESKVNLRRIDPQLNKNAASVNDVLLIFWAKVGKRDYRVVGWYEDATIWKEAQTNRCKDRDIKYFIAEATRGLLLPTGTKFPMALPVGKKGEVGPHAGNWYTFSDSLEHKNLPWLRRIISFIDSYTNGENDYESAIDMDTAEDEKKNGFQSNPRIRKAIELYAEKKAIEWFESQDFTFVRKVGKPFDLIFTKDSKQLFVEVKGTQTDGSCIFLTYNEVECSKEKQPNYALFLLRLIKIDDAEKPTSSGGVPRIIHRFQPKGDRLKAISYRYQFGHI
jgi:hypothetical protein